MRALRLRSICLPVFCVAVVAFTEHSIAQTTFPPPADLVSWWDADSLSGSIFFDIEDGNDGLFTAGATTAPGRVGQAFSFDGVDDMLIVPDANNLDITTDLTIEAWIKPDTLPLVHQIVGKDGPFPDRSYVLAIGHPYVGRLEWFINSSSTSPTHSPFKIIQCPAGPPYDFVLGEWHHVAGTYKFLGNGTSEMKLYVNGVMCVEDNTAPGPIQASSSSVTIGNRIENLPATQMIPFDGLIDEIGIYSRALSDPEILAIFDAGSAGKSKDDDGDGFRPPDDCDETDAAINPDAVEINFNFVDENCDGNLGECDPCFAWSNHGEYVRCVAQAVGDCSLNSFTPEEANALVTSAAHSQIGKKGFVPPECTP